MIDPKPAPLIDSGPIDPGPPGNEENVWERPLAEALRPSRLEEVIGQEDLLGPTAN